MRFSGNYSIDEIDLNYLKCITEWLNECESVIRHV